jgi:zinc protease
MSLTFVGDIKAQRALELARAAFGGLAATQVPLPRVAPEPPITSPRTRLHKAPTRGIVVSYAWHTTGIDHKRDVCATDLIYAILGEGLDARLAKALTTEEGLQGLPSVEYITKRDPGLFIIQVICGPDDEHFVRPRVLAEVSRLRDERVTDATLDEAKALIKTAYSYDNENFTGQVGSMGFYEAIDTYHFALDYADEVSRVTPDDIQRVARTYLKPESYVLSIIRPQGEDTEVLEARVSP